MTIDELWTENSHLRALLKQQGATMTIMQQEILLFRRLVLTLHQNGLKIGLDSKRLIERIAKEAIQL